MSASFPNMRSSATIYATEDAHDSLKEETMIQFDLTNQRLQAVILRGEDKITSAELTRLLQLINSPDEENNLLARETMINIAKR